MRTKTIRLDDLAAISIATEQIELEVLTSMGPRVIAARRPGGAQLMFQNLVDEDRPDYAPQKWRAMGGGRAWPHSGPIADEDERAYAEDNGRCEVVEDSPGCLMFWGAKNERFQLQRGLTIRETPVGVDITYLLKNRSGGMLMYGGLWAIAALNIKNPAETAAIGILTNDLEANWQTGRYQIVWHWAGHHTTPEFMEKQLSIRDGLLVVKLCGTEGKVMAKSPVGAIIATGEDTSFFKVIETDSRWDQLLPGGCNTAVYTCPSFAESETMGPALGIRSGETVCHTERWALTPPQPWDSQALYREVARIKAAAPFINTPSNVIA